MIREAERVVYMWQRSVKERSDGKADKGIRTVVYLCERAESIAFGVTASFL